MDKIRKVLIVLRGLVAINGTLVELNTELELTIGNLTRVEKVHAVFQVGSFEIVAERTKVIVVITEQQDDESRVVVKSVLRLDSGLFDQRRTSQDGKQE